MASKVDQNLCIGCGACVAICPSGFKMNDQGKSVETDVNADCAQKAADACPVQAITVEIQFIVLRTISKLLGIVFCCFLLSFPAVAF